MRARRLLRNCAVCDSSFSSARAAPRRFVPGRVSGGRRMSHTCRVCNAIYCGHGRCATPGCPRNFMRASELRDRGMLLPRYQRRAERHRQQRLQQSQQQQSASSAGPQGPEEAGDGEPGTDAVASSSSAGPPSAASPTPGARPRWAVGALLVPGTTASGSAAAGGAVLVGSGAAASSASGRDREADLERSGLPLCVVCMTDERDIIVLPCSHLCLCSHCSRVLQLRGGPPLCPMCRQAACEFRRIFL